MIKKWLIPLTVLTLSLAVAGIVTGFTLIGGTDPVQSDSGIDPNECDLVHNLAACDGNPTLEDPPLPTYEDWLRDHGNATVHPTEQGIDDGEWKVVTSIDDIDLDKCNMIHNINACTPEELEEFGRAPIATGEVTGNPEPLFVDGDPRYGVQPIGDEQDCGSVDGTFYISSDGQTGCTVVHVLEDGAEGQTQGQPPQILPTPE